MEKSSKQTFSSKRIVLIAVFSALAYVVSLFDFPIFPAVPFLKLDFGNVFIMLVGFLLGPLDGVITCIIKELLYLPVGGTGGVGQLANALMTCSYILLPSVAYRLRKGLKVVIPSLAIAGLLATGVALLTNRYILFPLYGITDAKAFFGSVVWYLVVFNLIKTTAISVLTLLLYKRLSNFIKGLKLERKKPQSSEGTAPSNKELKAEGKLISESVEQTQAIACEYAKTLKAGDVVLLDGDMGAGKTAFAKGVALGLGIEEEVTSPTYAYMNDYDGRLFHYDCYRIESVEQAENLGLADYFDMGGICLIEWSQNIAPLLPKVVKRVKITKIDETKREIEL